MSRPRQLSKNNYFILFMPDTFSNSRIEGMLSNEYPIRRISTTMWKFSDEEAENVVMEPNGSFMHYYEYLFEIFERSEMKAAIVANPEDDPNQVTPIGMVNNFVIRGSAKTVTSQLIDFYKRVGGFGTILMTAHDWIDKAKMKRSMELMATQVLPAVNQHLAASE